MNEKEILENYVHAKRRHSEIEEAEKSAKAVLEQAESLLVQSLIDREAKATAKYDGLGFASLAKPKVYANYAKENEDKVFKFVEDQGEKEIIKLSIHPQTLNGFVGRLIEVGASIPLLPVGDQQLPLIAYYLKQGVRFYARD